jgi:hypothetical protein
MVPPATMAGGGVGQTKDKCVDVLPPTEARGSPMSQRPNLVASLRDRPTDR